MNRNVIIGIVIIVTGVTIFAIPSVAFAQENESSTNSSQVQDSERYDGTLFELSDNVVVTDYSFNFEDNTITVWMDSGYREEVVLTDAVMNPDTEYEEVNRQTYIIDGPTEVTFSLSEVDNTMGVTLAGDRLYRIAESDAFIEFTGSYSTQQVIVYGLFSAFTGISLVLGIAYKRRADQLDSVEMVVNKRNE